MENFTQFKALVRNRYKGPRNQRVCTNLGYARFVDTDTRDSFLKVCKNTPFMFGDRALKVLPALTKLSRQRGWSLAKAERQLKKAAPGKKVESTKKPKRQVLVDGEVAFDQAPNTLGCFVGAYTGLSL